MQYGAREREKVACAYDERVRAEGVMCVTEEGARGEMGNATDMIKAG